MTTQLSAEELSQHSTQWLGLTIINKSKDGDNGYVEFEANFLDSNKQRQSHYEKSVFKRIAGKWLYVA